MTDIEPILERLGLQQYLEIFLTEGFDTWEAILDIQESDLEYLNIKLGHRRKLQRAIAEWRGSHNYKVLGLSPQDGTVIDEQDTEKARREAVSSKEQNPPAPTEQKRRYRRHPKPDENAPEKPPSAYVLFSNKIRDEVKGDSLSFTEIARLVGERWQKLDPAEKEGFGSHASALKETYHAQLSEYKRTEVYKEYNQYLAEFKMKHAGNSNSNSNKDSSGGNSGDSKRPRLDSSSETSIPALSPTKQFENSARSISVESASAIPYQMSSTVSGIAGGQMHNTLPQLSTRTAPRSPTYQFVSQNARRSGGLSSQSSISEESLSTRTTQGESPTESSSRTIAGPMVENTPLTASSQRTGWTEYPQSATYPTSSTRRPAQTFPLVNTSGQSPINSTPSTAASGTGGDWWRERNLDPARQPMSGRSSASSLLAISQLVASTPDDEMHGQDLRTTLPPIRSVSNNSPHVSHSGLWGVSHGQAPYHAAELSPIREAQSREGRGRFADEAADALLNMSDRRSDAHQSWMPRSKPGG